MVMISFAVISDELSTKKSEGLYTERTLTELNILLFSFESLQKRNVFVLDKRQSIKIPRKN
jgi:hypothetical protein